MSDARTRERLRSVPADPMEWRPQEPLLTRFPVTIADPVIEPLWSGERVLVHIDRPDGDALRVRMIDTRGRVGAWSRWVVYQP